MIVLRNVSALYDGTAPDVSAVRYAQDLAIDGGRIVGVRPHDPRSDWGNVTIVDASDLVVTPGLVDCHGHVTILGLGERELPRGDGPAGMIWVEKVLHRSLVEGGVTTMRDVGGATHQMKRLVDEGALIGPRLKIAICMLSTTGGHADFRGPDRCHGELSRLFSAGPGRPSSIVDGPWECRKRVREILACGADLVKICTSPGIASPTDHLEHRDFTAEEIAAICDEAAARGAKVAAHAHSRNGIALAIEHGVADIQHVSFMDDELAARAAAKGCSVTPTSWVLQLLPSAASLSPFVKEKVGKAAQVHAAAVDAARRGGLKILAGTDPVLPGMHGRNYMEMAALVADGLPPLQAWHAMTGLAAREIGQDDAGTILPGQRADLLLCRGNVLEDPALLDAFGLVEVVKDGIAYRGAIPELPQRTYRQTTDALWADPSSP